MICEACGQNVNNRRECPDCGLIVCTACRYAVPQECFCSHGSPPPMPIDRIEQLERKGKVKSVRISDLRRAF